MDTWVRRGSERGGFGIRTEELTLKLMVQTSGEEVNGTHFVRFLFWSLLLLLSCLSSFLSVISVRLANPSSSSLTDPRPFLMILVLVLVTLCDLVKNERGGRK
jgi:hypothetical protein